MAQYITPSVEQLEAGYGTSLPCVIEIIDKIPASSTSRLSLGYRPTIGISAPKLMLTTTPLKTCHCPRQGTPVPMKKDTNVRSPENVKQHLEDTGLYISKYN